MSLTKKTRVINIIKCMLDTCESHAPIVDTYSPTERFALQGQ